MIQVNLLPNVKLEYVKARRMKRTVITICLFVSALSILVFTLFFISVSVVQKQHLSNLDKDIIAQTKELEEIPNVAKVLTVQNQLNSLPALHKDKPVASRVFTYIQQLAPQEASIGSLTIDFDQQTMIITGNAASLASVNKFADTIKFTSYAYESDEAAPDKKPAFSEVTLSQFGFSNTGASSKKPASYTITLKYAPEIFGSENKTKLVIPNQVTTRSLTEKPQGVFEAPTIEGDDQ